MKFFIAALLFVSLNACVSSKGIHVKMVSATTYKAKEASNILDHSTWDALLKKYVTEDGFVNYKGFKDDSGQLNNYISYLAKQKPNTSWSTQEQLAYFINVYNANTVKLIVGNYPVKSIKDINATISPFLKRFIVVGNKKVSLADIEKGILRKMNEPRIHFAINCASYSCPKLMRNAYTAQNVNDLMDQAAKEFVNSDKNNISENSAELSEIFKWYKKDFLKHSPSIIDYVNQYADQKINAGASIGYLPYNWNLNEQK